MPPCEPLTTTAPAASGPTRVMLSAVNIGGSSGTGLSQTGRPAHHSSGTRVENKPDLSLCGTLLFPPQAEKLRGKLHSASDIETIISYRSATYEFFPTPF